MQVTTVFGGIYGIGTPKVRGLIKINSKIKKENKKSYSDGVLEERKEMLFLSQPLFR